MSFLVSNITDEFLVVDPEGDIWFTANPKGKPQKLDITNISSVTLGPSFSFFVDKEGNLWISDWCYCNSGRNSKISLSKVPNMQRVSAQSMASNHAIFLDQDLNAWSSGLYNDCGQMGLNNFEQSPEFIPHQIPNLPKITAVAAGFYHSLFLDEQGEVWGCGSNEHGQLGLEAKVPRSTPAKNPHLKNIRSISAGLYHSLFVDVNDLAWGCGRNFDGQLPFEHELEISSMFLKQSNSPKVKAL